MLTSILEVLENIGEYIKMGKEWFDKKDMCILFILHLMPKVFRKYAIVIIIFAKEKS